MGNSDNINVDDVVEQIHDLLYGGQKPSEWIEEKHIDLMSLDKFCSATAEDAIEKVMGRLSVTQNPNAIKDILYSLIGRGIQLGYSISEIQLENLFTSIEPPDDVEGGRGSGK